MADTINGCAYTICNVATISQDLWLKCVLVERLGVYFEPFDADRTINLMVMTISDGHLPLTKKTGCVLSYTVTLQAHVASSL